jgi:hypothetical protein
MTPLALEMLIWFRTRSREAGPFPNINYGPQSEIVQRFLKDGIIEPYEDVSPCFTYRTTDRGDAWLNLFLDTPIGTISAGRFQAACLAPTPVTGTWGGEAGGPHLWSAGGAKL